MRQNESKFSTEANHLEATAIRAQANSPRQNVNRLDEPHHTPTDRREMEQFEAERWDGMS